MKRDSTKVLWQVQVRKSRAHKWVNKGRFETRRNARLSAETWRDWAGFGNTRVVRVAKA